MITKGQSTYLQGWLAVTEAKIWALPLEWGFFRSSDWAMWPCNINLHYSSDIENISLQFFFIKARSSIVWFQLLGGVFGVKCRDLVKLDRARNTWYVLLCVFWLLLPKFNLVLVQVYVSTQIWDFAKISWFPKILSLKLFGNSWVNLYTKFAIKNITFRFTCG